MKFELLGPGYRAAFEKSFSTVRLHGLHGAVHCCNAIGEALSDRGINPIELEGVRNPNDPEWDLGIGWKGALAMTERGAWEDGLARVKKEWIKLAPAMDGPVRRTLGASGALPCVPVAIAGSPNCYWRASDGERIRAARPSVRIALCAICPASVDAKQREKAALSILGMVAALEAHDVRVSIDVASRNQYLDFAMPIKALDAPLSLGALSVVLHPGFFRRIMFRMIELSAVESGNANQARGFLGGYGSANEIKGYDCTIQYGEWGLPAEKIAKKFKDALEIRA